MLEHREKEKSSSKPQLSLVQPSREGISPLWNKVRSKLGRFGTSRAAAAEQEVRRLLVLVCRSRMKLILQLVLFQRPVQELVPDGKPGSTPYIRDAAPHVTSEMQLSMIQAEGIPFTVFTRWHQAAGTPCEAKPWPEEFKWQMRVYIYYIYVYTIQTPI